MTPEERRLIAAVWRWARSVDWHYRKGGVEQGTDPHPQCLRVEWYARRGILLLRRHDGLHQLPVHSVQQAIDLLVTYGMLPHRFRSAEPDGWEEWVIFYRTPTGRGRYVGATDSQERAALIVAVERKAGREVIAYRTRISPDEEIAP